jgi:hypothetical protein
VNVKEWKELVLREYDHNPSTFRVNTTPYNHIGHDSTRNVGAWVVTYPGDNVLPAFGTSTPQHGRAVPNEVYGIEHIRN